MNNKLIYMYSLKCLSYFVVQIDSQTLLIIITIIVLLLANTDVLINSVIKIIKTTYHCKVIKLMYRILNH